MSWQVLYLGDYTVSSGWFNAEIMLYMAFVAVANYTQPNFEMGYVIEIYASDPPGSDCSSGLDRIFTWMFIHPVLFDI